MKFVKTKLDGVYVIEPNIFEDERGEFIKTFHKDTFIKNGLNVDFKESYYSISKKNVLRGMHFQTPPQDYSKLVYVTSGSIIDVVLDIRKGSPTYGKYTQVELSDRNGKSIYIQAGFAHGFLSLEDDTCVIYAQTAMYSPENDSGIRADSFGFNWPVDKYIISKRDQNFVDFKNYASLFVYSKK